MVGSALRALRYHPFVVSLGLCAAAAAAFAEPSGDRPDAFHAWAVHDVNRPDPARIEVRANGVPSDAIVLFDGSAESVAKNWCAGEDKPTKWKVDGGLFVCTPGSGGALTKESFGDCQLHLEFMTPKDDLYGWGNSGVIFMGEYEIQILDSSAVVPSRSPFKPANYADGQCGAVYGQNPPLVQPCRRPGEWQTYDIVFHPPRREGERLVDAGSVTVFLNGVLVQDDFPFQGKTTWCRRLPHSDKSAGPLCLQDHGHPVPYRNIWIRRIPSRYADTLNGGLGVKRGDVAAKRHALAQESLALAGETTDRAERFIRLWESFCYEPDMKVKKQVKTATDDLVAAIRANDPEVVRMEKFGALKRFVKMLVLGKWLEDGTELEKTIDAYKAPAKPKSPNMRDL